MEQERKIHKILNIRGSMDWSIYFVVMFLIAFGVIMVYSSSFNLLLDYDGKVLPLKGQIWWKQLIYGIIGMVIITVGAHIQVRFSSAMLSIIGYPAALALMMLVIFKGDATRGAARAIKISSFSFQPSELTKLAVIVTLAILLEKWQQYLNKPKALFYLLAVLTVPVALVAKEDYSTAAVILAIGGGMIFVAYRNIWQTVVMGGGLGGTLLVFFYFLKSNRQMRMSLMKGGAWQQADGAGRQTVQSLLAIGSGGFFGRGLGQSLQKMGRISQAHHDIIFAIICEELGFFGAGLILLLYLGLLYQLLQTAAAAGEIRDSLIVIGVMLQIVSQVVINIGVASSLLPNTGMPLPFISYGGSSLLFLCMEIALVLSIAKKNQYQYMKKIEAISE